MQIRCRQISGVLSLQSIDIRLRVSQWTWPRKWISRGLPSTSGSLRRFDPFYPLHLVFACRLGSTTLRQAMQCLGQERSTTAQGIQWVFRFMMSRHGFKTHDGDRLGWGGRPHFALEPSTLLAHIQGLTTRTYRPYPSEFSKLCLKICSRMFNDFSGYSFWLCINCKFCL